MGKIMIVAFLVLFGSAAGFHAYDVQSVASHGVIEEDDPRWDCRTMGNRVCGPDNAQDVPAGDYTNGPERVVIGEYDVPTGTFTVYADASARYTPHA